MHNKVSDCYGEASQSGADHRQLCSSYIMSNVQTGPNSRVTGEGRAVYS